ERDQAPDGESASMRQEAVRRTLARVTGLDFHRVVDTRGVRTAGLCGLASAAFAVAFGLAAPGLAGTAALRLANPFASIDWPRKTRIDLERVVERIGRNKEYRLRGTVAGFVPKEVVAVVSYEGFPAQHKTFSVKDDNSFVMHLKPDEVQRDFRFRLLA